MIETNRPPTVNSGQTLILLRTHKFDAAVQQFAELLNGVPGYRFACLLDGRKSRVEVGNFARVYVEDEEIRKLGLHCPSNYVWRCGDYGLYLAQKTWPEFDHIWLVEYDVRVGFPSLADFFASFAGCEHDLIAPMYQRRDAGWFWSPSMAVRDQPVFGCLFPILRVSRRAILACLAERQRMGRSPVYRAFWPNDEAMLATFLSRNGFACVDFNDLGQFYSSETLSFEKPFRLETFETYAETLIYHPVLAADDYETKLKRLSNPISRFEDYQRRIRRRLRYLVS